MKSNFFYTFLFFVGLLSIFTGTLSLLFVDGKTFETVLFSLFISAIYIISGIGCIKWSKNFKASNDINLKYSDEINNLAYEDVKKRNVIDNFISLLRLIWGSILVIIGIVAGITWLIFCFGSVIIGIVLLVFCPTCLFFPFGLVKLGLCTVYNDC